MSSLLGKGTPTNFTVIEKVIEKIRYAIIDEQIARLKEQIRKRVTVFYY